MKELTNAPESLFWYWIAERHAVFLRRQAGQPKPWTTDPIFRDYKFTNPFRENDRGTVWLRENFLKPYQADSEHDTACREQPASATCICSADETLGLLAFNICWYRMFNWTGTGEFLGWQTDWKPDIIAYDLDQRALEGEQIFTGAHIVYSPPGRPKIDSIVDVCTVLWKLRDAIVTSTRVAHLQHTFEVLKTVHCVGPFMAYEMVTDMRHTRLLEDATDIMTWANPGPGARRGLQRLGLPWKPDSTAIDSMRRLLHIVVNEPVIDFDLQIKMPSIEMRDIEHSLCEFDKYCRVKFGEGEPRSKYPGAA